jgi:hypothetical protein
MFATDIKICPLADWPNSDQSAFDLLLLKLFKKTYVKFENDISGAEMKITYRYIECFHCPPFQSVILPLSTFDQFASANQGVV